VSKVDGLQFKYLDMKTKKWARNFSRLRFDKPKAGQKYSQPVRSGVRLYFPPTWAMSMDDVKRRNWWDAVEDNDDKPRTVVIVEGEKKALALQQELGARVVVVGVGGVWNWGEKADDGDRTLIDEWRIIKRWKDRDVYICFDSDVESNAQVNTQNIAYSDS
jgi:hypothetical protein